MGDVQENNQTLDKTQKISVDKIDNEKHEKMYEEMECEAYPYGKPKIEMDEPINTGERANVWEASIPLDKQIQENDKNRAEKKYFKAYNLILICLGLLAGLYIFDCTIQAVSGQINDNFSMIAESVKAMLFTVSGYLFAEKNNAKEG